MREPHHVLYNGVTAPSPTSSSPNRRVHWLHRNCSQLRKRNCASKNNKRLFSNHFNCTLFNSLQLGMPNTKNAIKQPNSNRWKKKWMHFQEGDSFFLSFLSTSFVAFFVAVCSNESRIELPANVNGLDVDVVVRAHNCRMLKCCAFEIAL